MLTKAALYSRPAISYLLSRSPILLLPFMLLGLIEFLDRGKVRETFNWVIEEFPELLANATVIGALFLGLIALTGRLRIAFWVLAVPLIVATFISGIKLKILGTPLLPWDLVLGKETADISQHLQGVLSFRAIAAIIVFLIVVVVLMLKVRLFRLKANWMERILFLLISVFIISSVYSGKPWKAREDFNIATIPWDQSQNYALNGFVLSTLMNIDQIFVPKPAGYSEETMMKIASEKPATPSGATKVKPNIIVILGEAFWDPTLMKNVKFDRDPIPTFHSIHEKYTGGWMLSPQFGGGTANVEFEVLTGLTTRFLPQGAIAYNQYVSQPIDSMASILQRQGYTTTSINPFHNWFYNSKNVYKNFGFSRFISQEFFEPVMKGAFYADSEVGVNIMNETAKTPGPDFVFANTMENHGPYYNGKFPDGVSFKAEGNFSEDSKVILENFAEGLYGTDQMIKALTEHYSKLNEPTIIAFFGDHLPLMGNDYQVYRETGYISPNDPDFVKKMYQTPYFVWDNYMGEAKKDMNISPFYLGPYILNQAGLEGTYYTDYLHSLQAKMPILPPQNMYDQYKVLQDEVDKLNMMQYDVLFGKRYGYLPFKDKILSEHFELGYAPVIEDVKVVNNELIVKGQHLPPDSWVYLNGKKLATKRNPDKTLSATLPKDGLGKGEVKVQIKIFDSKNIEASESAVFDATSKVN